MEKIRISFLATIFFSVFLFLGRAIIVPTASKAKVPPFVFPSTVPLPGWQLNNSHSLTAPIADSNYLSGRHYLYNQNGQTLDIEIRYVVNTKGDVESFIQNYSPIAGFPSQFLLTLRQQKGIGFYSLFTDKQRAYLSTCINSRGGTTVTVSQFRRNRDIYDNIYSMRFKERLLPWLQGQGSIRDMRCLWAHLSTSVKDSSPEDAYQTLEKAWFSWYQWWRLRFPQP